MNILITGGAGFIGYHLALTLLKKNNKIFIVDNLNNYYDPSLKISRLKNLIKIKNKKKYFLKFKKCNIEKFNILRNFFKKGGGWVGRYFSKLQVSFY